MKMLIIKTASVYICLRILRGPLKRVGYYRPRSRKMNTLPGQGATLTHMEASVSDRKREQLPPTVSEGGGATVRYAGQSGMPR